MTKATTFSLYVQNETPAERLIKRIGSQKGRINVGPKGASYSEGKDAADLCIHYWFTPDEWQQDLLTKWLSRDENGKLLVLTAGLSVPRQNGKNGAVEAFEFYLLVTDPNVHILHTAHQVKTCKKAFKRLVKIFTDKRYKDLLQLVRDIRRTNGEEGIYLWHPDHIGEIEGASIEYSARSRGSARGFDKISHIIYDECQELTDEQVEALLFTLGASETDRFILYTGTPPGENCPGEVFERTRTRALNNPTAHMAWDEWSINELLPETSTWEDVEPFVWQTNPAMGRRLSIEFTQEEFNNTSIEGFCRERLGWWSSSHDRVELVFGEDEWMECAIQNAPQDAPDCFGIKFNPQGTSVSLGVCILDDKPFIELIEDKSTSHGTKWLVDFMRSHQEAPYVIDGRSGAQALIDRVNGFDDWQGQITVPNASEAISAATGMLNAVREQDLSFYQPLNAPQDRLTQSVLSVVRRPIGSGGGWGFGGADANPAEAVALALWGAQKLQLEDDDEEMEVYF